MKKILLLLISLVFLTTQVESKIYLKNESKRDLNRHNCHFLLKKYVLGSSEYKLYFQPLIIKMDAHGQKFISFDMKYLRSLSLNPGEMIELPFNIFAIQLKSKSPFNSADESSFLSIDNPEDYFFEEDLIIRITEPKLPMIKESPELPKKDPIGIVPLLTDTSFDFSTTVTTQKK